MRRERWLILIVVILGALVCASWALGNTGRQRYVGPIIFSPDEFHSDSSDGPCQRWFVNEMYKSETALGTVTFIDDSGNWHYTVKNYSYPTQSITLDFDWHKKPLCKNSSSITYWANCWDTWATGVSCVLV